VLTVAVRLCETVCDGVTDADRVIDKLVVTVIDAELDGVRVALAVIDVDWEIVCDCVVDIVYGCEIDIDCD